jgi:CRISPR-associated protein Cas1
LIKRTLYFENPAYLSVTLSQLKIKIPEVEKNLPKEFSERFTNSIPIEDIGVVILDNPQITITQRALQALNENNCAVIICDDQRMPYGLLLPLTNNTLQGERYRYQINASVPLKKQLWQQTVQAKISNQATLLKHTVDIQVSNMVKWAKEVKSGDTTNMEARAAVYYWANIFPYNKVFIRDRYGMPPNNLLNYGYSILRSIIARSLVGTGLLPTLGIHHRNKYNAYALADDIMEPYRPFVDSTVLNIINSGLDYNTLNREVKIQLMSIPVLDVRINDLQRPLQIASSITTASLLKCFTKEESKILYPEIGP